MNRPKMHGNEEHDTNYSMCGHSGGVNGTVYQWCECSPCCVAVFRPRSGGL